MKKRLLITASTFPRWENDTEPRFVLDLAKALTKYFDMMVIVPASPGAADLEILEGIKVVRYRYFPVRKWETLCYPGAIVPRIKEKKSRIFLVPFLFFGLWRNLKKMEGYFDVVHAHWLIPQGILQSFFKTPYVVTGHGGDVTSLNKGIFKSLKKKALENAASVTVVSEALREEIMQLYPGIDVTVQSMGCNVKEFSPDYRKENLFQQGDKKVVLFVGRLAEKKGVTYLIDAIKNVDAKLVIVGEGNLEEKLKKQAEPLGDKVQFLGSKTHQELKEIYASADVFVAPSVTAEDGDKEGLGLVLLEAMASGLPVVGSESGGIPEIVRDGYNGFLVPERDVRQLAEKINLLLSDVDLSAELAQNGIKTAAERDYEVIAWKYAKILGEAIDG